MADGSMLQAVADGLFALEKIKVNDEVHEYPFVGGRLKADLTDRSGHEQFILDVGSSRIDLAKATYQNRTRQTIILARLDISGPPHTNPDGIVIPCPHLHRYHEGYGDKWATAIPPNVFSNTSDLWVTFEEFCVYCNIVEPPNVQRGLFS